MSSHKTARVARVLSGALRVWGVAASVEADPALPGSLVLHTQSGERIQIAPGSPHGWLIVRGSRAPETHAGLPGLLRSLRQELAPQAAAGRLIIGAQSLL